jgi:hypothetical protein
MGRSSSCVIRLGVPVVRRFLAPIFFSAVGTALATCGSAHAVEVPEITELKPLRLETDLVRDGRAHATVVVPTSGSYDAPASRIVEAVQKRTGVELPIVQDDAPGASLPLRGHVIALGNRSTNKLIGDLYNRYYTLLDLRYPGKGGHVVRTLHDPFGDGFNVVFVGGSDRAGVEKATDAIIDEIGKAATNQAIQLGRLAVIRLGEGVEVPRDVRDVETWEASAGYGSIGYFGWNSISKRMALYYMTGDLFHAREFLRLAFPDEKARQEIAEIDGERIEDKDHPLSGPYHYNAHMMILFWDLIEESPVFSDGDRLRVTRAFAEQVNHWAGSLRATAAPRAVGSRHGQWDAISLYCLARYFQTHYPDPFWGKARQAGRLHFGSLHQYAWVSGENDNLFWYNTAIAPIFTYMVLTGDRVPLENGVLRTLLRGQEILVSGRVPDWALNSASLGFLHKAAYLTQDGRWLAYRDRTGVDTSVFRLGQSFWPEEDLQPVPPEDLVGKWTIHRLSKPKWEARRSGLALEESFEFGSLRSQSDAGGDYLLIDGFNGASRNPYHTFAILELRLSGYTLLKGYLNQVITRVDGLMEPKIAMNAALKRCDVIGSTAVAVAEVPNAAYANWRRTIVQRIGRYALIVDELTFREDSPNADLSFEWETERAAKRVADGKLLFSASTERGERRTDPGGQIVTCDPMETTGGGRRWTMRWSGPVRAGERNTFFSLVGMEPGASELTMECYRTGTHAAALALPEAAVVVAPSKGNHGNTNSGIEVRLAVLATDHLFATGLTKFFSFIHADKPIDADWDLATGDLHVVATDPVEVGLWVEHGAKLTVDEKPADVVSGGEPSGPDNLVRVRVPGGRHVIRGALPRSAKIPHGPVLASLLETARKSSSEATASQPGPEEPAASTWKVKAQVPFGSSIVDLEAVPTGQRPLVAAAEGSTVHLIALDGQEKQTLATDGPIRMLRWWPEAKLLLAGCADEKVIAFDEAGERKWVFVSEMDPAVFRAAKTYWFKSAPGHEGIHGLHTGEFLDGGSQAFVGSACTLEILDRGGRLLHRMPQFWGKVSKFAIVDGPDDTKNLLAARKYNGTNTVAIVNSATLNPSPRGFISVPSGQTYMPGWSSMNRHHLFYEDLDGDGTREVVSEINGTWNRVCVWAVDGKPMHAANFGPGPRIPARTMRDIDVGDLDGDGKKEIVAATSYRMVVALDGQCNKLWARRLASPAQVLTCVRPKGAPRARIVLGCDDGRVRVLDAAGNLIGQGDAGARPTCIEGLSNAEGEERVVIGTNTGGVSIFAIEG